MQASKVRGSKTGLESSRSCAASRLRSGSRTRLHSAAKRRNQPPETTQEDTRHTVKFNSGLDRQTGQERLPDVTVSSKGGPLTPALSPSEGERENRRQLSGESRLMGREIPPSAGGSVNWCHVRHTFALPMGRFSCKVLPHGLNEGQLYERTT